jgi:Fis family transcriptional regulator, factor for inversion stimulation protein
VAILTARFQNPHRPTASVRHPRSVMDEFSPVVSPPLIRAHSMELSGPIPNVSDPSPAPSGAASETKMVSLRECVASNVRRALESMGNNLPKDFFELVMREVERPLLEEVSRHCHGNQSRMADVLGLSRTTLRKKLKAFDL